MTLKNPECAHSNLLVPTHVAEIRDLWYINDAITYIFGLKKLELLGYTTNSYFTHFSSLEIIWMYWSVVLCSHHALQDRTLQITLRKILSSTLSLKTPNPAYMLLPHWARPHGIPNVTEFIKMKGRQSRRLNCLFSLQDDWWLGEGGQGSETR